MHGFAGRRLLHHSTESGNGLSGKSTISENAQGAAISFRKALATLNIHGINVLGEIASSRSSAETIAKNTDAPGRKPDRFVLKAATNQKQKMKAGLVKLDVPLEGVGEAYDELKAKSGKNEVLVAPMAEQGVEMMLGAKMTEYGVAVVIGAGGSRTEEMKDVQVCIKPKSEEEVLEKIGKLRMFPLLNGEQGLPKVDVKKVAKLAVGLARVVEENPECEADLNPVRVYENNAVALDFRVVQNGEYAKPEEGTVSFASFVSRMQRALNAKSIAYVGATDKVFGVTNEGKVVGIKSVREVPQEEVFDEIQGRVINPGYSVATVVVGKGETAEMKVGAEVDIVDHPNKTLAKNLLDFPGGRYFVNPKGGEILGEKVHTSVKELPEVPDMAVVLVDAERSIDVLEECGKKGIKVIVMENSGFKEVGNHELEQRLKEVIDRYQLTVIGPNGIGLYVPDNGIDLMFLAKEKNRRMQGGGGISVFSQSGSLVSIEMEDQAELGGKLNAFLSVGNMSGVTNTQLLYYFEHDEKTKVIGVVAEGIPDGEDFMGLAKLASRHKPVVMLKLGKTGSKKTSSHTGSLAGDYNSFLAAAEKSGVIVVDNIDQFWLACKVLEHQPLPEKSTVAMVTNAGGHLTQAFDEMGRAGVGVAGLEEKTGEAIGKVVSKNVTVSDAAIDLAADTNPVVLDKIVGAFKGDANVGFLWVVPFAQPPTMTEAVLESVTKHKGDKPLCVVLNKSEFAAEWRRKLEAEGIPTTTSHRDAAAVTGAIMRYAEWRRNLPPEPVFRGREMDMLKGTM